MRDSGDSGSNCLSFWTLDPSRRHERRKKFKFKWIIDKSARNKPQPVLRRTNVPPSFPRKRACTQKQYFIPESNLQFWMKVPNTPQEENDADTNDINHAEILTKPSAEATAKNASKQRLEDNWQKVRPDMHRQFTAQEARRKERIKLRREWERNTFIHDVASNSTPCPECGCEYSDTIHGNQVVFRPAVWVVTFDFCHQIELPIFNCARCSTPDGKQMRFNMHPIELGAFPATPVRPHELYSQKGKDRIVLYSIELLELLRDAVDACPKQDITSFARLMCRRITQNGCELPISEDYLRKQLGRALNEFSRVVDAPCGLNENQS